MRRLGCLLGLLIGGILLIPRRGRTSPPPSRPFPLNGRGLTHGPACWCDGEGLTEGRHSDGSCAFCDWLDETPVPEYRRRGAL
jgi:hypothetical protein